MVHIKNTNKDVPPFKAGSIYCCITCRVIFLQWSIYACGHNKSVTHFIFWSNVGMVAYSCSVHIQASKEAWDLLDYSYGDNTTLYKEVLEKSAQTPNISHTKLS